MCVSARAALQPFPGAAGYITAKAGVLAFVKALDAEYRDAGVRANAILPSVIDTPANRESMPDADWSKWVTPDGDRPGDPLPDLRRVGADERRRRAGLRPRLDRHGGGAPLTGGDRYLEIVSHCCLAVSAAGR